MDFLQMDVNILHLLILLYGNVVVCSQQEPVCMSRFDYEHKMLHSIVKLEIEQEKHQESIEKLRQDLEKENTAIKEEIKQLRDAVASQELAIKASAIGNQKLHTNLTTHCSQQCKSGDGMDSEGYTFKDYLAQATCTALGTRHVYAVRRTCSSSYHDCAAVCRSLGKSCLDSLHVYARKNTSTNDVGKEGLKMYRYKHCGGGCGPNFCCCQSA